MQHRQSRIVGASLCLLLGAQGLRAQDGVAEPPRLARWSWDVSDAHRAAGRVLRESRTQAITADGSALESRLLAIGADRASVLLDILTRGRVPESSENDAPQIVSEPQRALLIRALAALPEQEVRALVDANLERDRSDAVELASIHALGAIGKAADVLRVCELVPVADGHATRAGCDALRGALTSILLRDSRAWSAVGRAIEKAPADVKETILSAAAETESGRAFSVILDAGRLHRDLAQCAVGLLRALSAHAGAEERRECADWCAGELDGARPELQRSLLKTIGSVDDGTLIPDLFHWIEDENANTREAAGLALRKITGVQFPTQAALWKAWYADEQQWMHRERPMLCDRLESRDRKTVIDALRQYAQRRTFRDELAVDVLPLLERPEQEVVLLTCEVLTRLGSSAAVPRLVALLDHESPQIAQAAAAAIEKISGRTVPASAEEARALLASQ